LCSYLPTKKLRYLSKASKSQNWDFFFLITGIWTHSLHLKPLHQCFFDGFFFLNRILWTICPGWLWTMILLISAYCS
jgi:hypothetical protein